MRRPEFAHGAVGKLYQFDGKLRKDEGREDCEILVSGRRRGRQPQVALEYGDQRHRCGKEKEGETSEDVQGAALPVWQQQRAGGCVKDGPCRYLRGTPHHITMAQPTMRQAFSRCDEYVPGSHTR